MSSTAAPAVTVMSSLHEKLALIRGSFGSIQKTGEMKEGPRFKYVEAREVAARFVELASARLLTMLPVSIELLNLRPTASGKQTVMTLLVNWAITDAESGESIIVSSIGEGADQSDKGAPKAQTNAMKYAILLLLQAAGDDAEADPNPDRLERDAAAHNAVQIATRPFTQPVVAAKREDAGAAAPSAALIRKLMATFDEKGLKDPDMRKAFTSATVGKSSSKDLTVADVEKVLIALADFKGVAEVSAQ